MQRKLLNKKGFTLIELLMSISLISILVLITMPISINYRDSSILKNELDTTIAIFNKANSLAVNSINSSSYGIKTTANSVILFKGSSYLSRDVSYDETYPLYSTISPQTEVVFSQNTGYSASDSTFFLTNNSGSLSFKVNITGLAYR